MEHANRFSKRKQLTEGDTPGHTRPKLLTVICVVATAVLAFRAEAQTAPLPAEQGPAPTPPPAAAAETTPSCKTSSKAIAGGANVVQAADESL
jgi:hypothetical protein